MGSLIALWESLSSRLIAVQNLPLARLKARGNPGITSSTSFRLSLQLIAIDRGRQNKGVRERDCIQGWGVKKAKGELGKLSAHVAFNAVGIIIICSIRQQTRAAQEVVTRSSLCSLTYLSSCPRACSMPTYIIHPPGAVCDMKLKLN